MRHSAGFLGSPERNYQGWCFYSPDPLFTLPVNLSFVHGHAPFHARRHLAPVGWHPGIARGTMYGTLGYPLVGPTPNVFAKLTTAKWQHIELRGGQSRRQLGFAARLFEPQSKPGWMKVSKLRISAFSVPRFWVHHFVRIGFEQVTHLGLGAHRKRQQTPTWEMARSNSQRSFGWSKPMGSHFGVGAPLILEPILGGLLTHGHFGSNSKGLASSFFCCRSTGAVSRNAAPFPGRGRLTEGPFAIWRGWADFTQTC